MCPNSQHCIDISTTSINSVRIMYVSARIHFSTANISGSVFCTNLRQLLTEIHTPQWPPQLVQNICSPGCLLSSRKFVLPRYKWNTTSEEKPPRNFGNAARKLIAQAFHFHLYRDIMRLFPLLEKSPSQALKQGWGNIFIFCKFEKFLLKYCV